MLLGTPARADGEHCGDRGCEEGLQARGEGGILLLDLQRPDLL